MRRHGNLYALNGEQAYRQHGDPSLTADPTPETIQLEASAIRLKWTKRQERNAQAISRWRWQAPSCPRDLQLMIDGSG